MRISIERSLLELFPDAVEYIVVLKGCSNMTAKSREIVEYMESAQKKMRSGEMVFDFEDDPRFKNWDIVQKKIAQNILNNSNASNTSISDDPYKASSQNIDGAGDKSMQHKAGISSHVSLVNKILAGKDLANINPIVNYYNIFSAYYGLPIGAEDLAKVYGDFVFKVSDGGEPFVSISSKDIESINRGDVILTDELGPTCKGWNQKQSERDKVGKYSTEIMFFFDHIDGDNGSLGNLYEKPIDFITSENASLGEGTKIDFQQLLQYFVSKLEYYFGGTYEIFRLDGNNMIVDFDANNLNGSQLRNLTLQEKHQYLQSIVDEIYTKGNKGITKRKAENLGLKNTSSPINVIDKKLLELCQSNGVLLDQDSFMLQSKHNIENVEYSTAIAMRVASQIGKQPKEIALQIKEIILSCSEIGSCEVAENGFINLVMSNEFYLSNLKNFYENFDDITESNAGENKTILIEMVSPNPNKALHLGHILNLFLGKSLLRIFNKVGFKAVEDCLVNDKGLPIAKTIWAIKKYGIDSSPEKEGLKEDHWVDKYYVMGANDFKNSLSVRKEVRAILRSIENEDPEILEIWKRVISHSVEGQRATLKRLGEDFGYLWYEHEIYKIGRNMIESHIDGKNVIKLPDGVVVGILEKTYGVPDVVLVKSDGTSLYHTQDLALTMKKIEKFNPWKAIWVVGNDQIVHFQRLFSLIDMLSVMPIDNLYHYAYGYVFDKDGKRFSSRSGDALSADELIDLILDSARKVIESRKEFAKKSQEDLSESNDEDIVNNLVGDEKENISEKVGLSALKYAFLSTDPYKDIRFDIEKSLSFSGKSGPYILYAFVRAKSILEKADLNKDNEEGDLLNKVGDNNSAVSLDGYSKNLIIKLFDYPDTIIASANNYMPSIIAEYLYDLSKDFSSFYENTDILGDSTLAKYYKLIIISLFERVISDGLELLGIETLDRM
ncbi:MAG TPA: arginine--tRNA ligase [Candidatus Dojkabacteria bacterium]|nr:arginine--tRNA ligase [Candidatus Dojkabacteria bacterium]